MSNLITYDARPDLRLPLLETPLLLGNGSMSVFVDVVSLAASMLASSDRQREFAAWFASHDQNVCGLGMAGFDISELPWAVETFEDDRVFLLGVVEASKSRLGWDRLGYVPDEDWWVGRMERALDAFEALLNAFAVSDAKGDEERVWPIGRPVRWVRCVVHGTYLHAHGCVLCTTWPEPAR